MGKDSKNDAENGDDDSEGINKVEFLRVKCCCRTSNKNADGCSWIYCANGTYPDSSVIGGTENGLTVLLARGHADGATIPGKYYPDHRTTIITNLSKVYEVKTYEILAAEFGTLAWVPSENGKVVKNAVIGGLTASGEQLYIGRRRYEDSFVPGKIQLLYKLIFVAWKLAECEFDEYEVLVKVNPGDLPKNGTWANVLGKSEAPPEATAVGENKAKGDAKGIIATDNKDKDKDNCPDTDSTKNDDTENPDDENVIDITAKVEDAQEIPVIIEIVEEIPEKIKSIKEIPKKHKSAKEIPEKRKSVKAIPKKHKSAREIPEKIPKEKLAKEIPEKIKIAKEKVEKHLPEKIKAAKEIVATEISEKPKPPKENPDKTKTAKENPDKTKPAKENPDKTKAAPENPDKTKTAKENPDKTKTAPENPEKPKPTKENPEKTKTAEDSKKKKSEDDKK